jgi:uncharacterized GH25 family protein
MLFAGAFTLILSAMPAAAHYASVTASDYAPAPGDTITVFIGWGHKFPGDGEMRHAAYDTTDLTLIGPDGEERNIPITPKKERGHEPIRVRLEKPGLHTFLLTQKKFSTKTAHGYKYQPRDELDHVIHSRWSETVSKAVVNVGGEETETPVAETRDRFQILALANPLSVKKGETLPVKVILDGKPWKGTVNATYAGFSEEKDAFAFRAETDDAGICRVQISEKGLWLVKADHSYPYEDTKKADEYSLKATLACSIE